MPDLAAISGVLSSVKTATDIAKIIKDSDFSLDTAENKFKVAELISALADVKLEVAELQDLLREKDEIIVTLKGEIKSNKTLKYSGKFYLAEGDETPFCAVCFERDKKQHHLTFAPRSEYIPETWTCKVCNSTFT